MSKVMVSLPEELLGQIDREVARRSLSRSALLAVATQREIARPYPDAVAAAISRCEERFRSAGTFDATELVRRDRDR